MPSTSHLLTNSRNSRPVPQALTLLQIYSASARTEFSPRDKSVIPNTIDASFNLRKVRSIPIFSTTSSVSRMPAVSMNRNITPPRLSVSSIVSRVVPAISETIALSSPRSAFSKVLLPVFVAPTIATGTPFLMALPRLKESVRRTIWVNVSSTNAPNSERLANSTSSSLKSSSSSSREVIVRSFSLRVFSSEEKPPFS